MGSLVVPSFEPTVARSPRCCPCCGSDNTLPFFELPGVPTNSCILLESADEARRCPVGRVLLCLCEECGFISNHAFEPILTEYSERYEETQGFSSTFTRYLEKLALDLVDRLGLQGKRIVEIGCGKGEFLALLCQFAEAEGIGFDPAFREDRRPGIATENVCYVRGFFSEAYANLDADLYCNRMTLEHISEVGDFLHMLRQTIGDRPGALVYCQVPESARILAEGLFCDVPYEHCSYFTRETLELAFRKAGFEVVGTEVGYGGQHLGLLARPGEASKERGQLEGVRRLALGFARRSAEGAHEWVELLNRTAERGESVVLWGSGSKATAFLTSLRVLDAVTQVVDINPYRQGRFMAGTGQPIVAPKNLRDAPPDHVIIMNPMYREEIVRTLESLGLAPQLHELAAVPSGA